MKQLDLNVGCIFTDSFLTNVINLNHMHADNHIQVTTLYGSAYNMTASARSNDRVPSLTNSELEAFTKKAMHHNIDIRWTLNQSCIGSMQDFHTLWENELKFTVSRLYSMGIREFTITSPLIMTLVHDLLRCAYLEVSTIVEISSSAELSRWKRLGANAANVSIMINRDINTLIDMEKHASDFAMTLTILANEACLWKCPYRSECYNLSSHNSSRDCFNNYPFQRCNQIRLDNPVEWIRARLLLPQWMRTYEQVTGINNFKITGRTATEETAIPIIERYMNQNWSGNLLELWPTIQHLSDTDEPIEHDYINCSKIDEWGFLKLFTDGFSCNDLVCDIDCKVCGSVYKAARR